MELSKQVVGLELSKRLKELGVENESLFYWTDNEIIFQEYCSHYENCISAFTASELLKMLPCEINGWTLRIIKNWNNTYSVAYPDLQRIHSIHFDDNNLSNALAKMLIQLIKQKIIEV